MYRSQFESSPLAQQGANNGDNQVGISGARNAGLLTIFPNLYLRVL